MIKVPTTASAIAMFNKSRRQAEAKHRNDGSESPLSIWRRGMETYSRRNPKFYEADRHPMTTDQEIELAAETYVQVCQEIRDRDFAARSTKNG